MAQTYAHLMSFCVTHPWAITRPMLSVIANVLARRVAGQDADPAEVAAALVNRKNLPQPRAGSIAIIPVYGVIAPRMNLMSEMSGGTTYEKLTSQLREAVATPDVKTIVLDIDSPGGNVAGATEFATEVRKARSKKAVIAQAQYTMASAAYWIGANATEVVASPSATLGSVGVYTAHNDLSEALAQMGVKRTYISAGTGKTDGNETGPLSAEALARIEASVTAAYSRMVADIVKGRGAGTTAARVQDDWQAHTYGADEALSLGMIDRIATLDETLARVLASSPDRADQRAAQTLAPDHVTPRSAGRGTDVALERAVFELSL